MDSCHCIFQIIDISGAEQVAEEAGFVDNVLPDLRTEINGSSRVADAAAVIKSG